jgi:integrase/recombinase XerD
MIMITGCEDASRTGIRSEICSYLSMLGATGYAVTTVTSRRAHLLRFIEWCEADGATCLGELTAVRLHRFREWVGTRRSPNGRPLDLSTQANQLTAVRMLCTWATRTMRIAFNPAAELERPRLPRRLPRCPLSSADVERVLAKPDITTLLGLRDRAIMEVLYSTGIRRMELVMLDIADLDMDRGVIFVREGKGRKDRVVPIGERAIRWTQRYLDGARSQLMARRRDGATALFLGARGVRVRATRLTERLHRYVVTALPGKTGSVHIFRHAMATLMHDGGADVRDLQEILGHSQLSTTEVYTHVSIARLKAVHARTHPACTAADHRRVPRHRDSTAGCSERMHSSMPEDAYDSLNPVPWSRGPTAPDQPRPDAAIKRALVAVIAATIRAAGMTQTVAAHTMGVDQAAASRLVRQHTAGFSVSRLLNCLTALGLNVEIVVRAGVGCGSARGRIVVVAH